MKARSSRITAYGVKLISIGFFLGPDEQAVIWRGPMVHSAIQQFVRDVNGAISTTWWSTCPREPVTRRSA